MSVNITLKEIIERKIRYFSNNTDKYIDTLCKGYIRGFEEMLEDIDLSEDEFIAKYIKKLSELSETIKKDAENGALDADGLNGYNNAFVDVLQLLDEEYVYIDFSE